MVKVATSAAPLLRRVAARCLFDLAGLRELAQAGRDIRGIEVQALSDITSRAARVPGEEVDDARLDVDLTAARGRAPLACPSCRRAAHRASRSGGRGVAIVSMELVDLLLEPSEMLLDGSALGLERLYDLLNTRQAAPYTGRFRESSIDVLADSRARAIRVAAAELLAPYCYIDVNVL